MTRRPRLVARSLLTSAALAASSIAMVGCTDDEVGNPKGDWYDAGEELDAGRNDAAPPPIPTVDAGQRDTGTTAVDSSVGTDAGEDDAG